jgi:Tfp pilus assembly protein PilF
MIIKHLISLLVISILISGCTTTQIKKNENNMSKEEKTEVYIIIKGMSLAENGKLEEALKVFKDGYSKNPKNIKIVRYLALAYSKLGDNINGKKYFEEALKIDKFDSESLYNYSILCYSEKEYIKAKELLERVKIESIDKKIVLAKGYVYYQLEEYQKSYNEFSKIIEDGTEYSIDVNNIYVIILKKVNKNDEIYNFLHTTYSKNKANFQNMKLLSDYLIEVKAYEKSEEFLKNYGRANGYSKELLIALGELMILKNDYNECKSYLNLLEDKYAMDAEVMKFKVKYFRGLNLEEEAKKIENILNNNSGSEK